MANNKETIQSNKTKKHYKESICLKVPENLVPDTTSLTVYLSRKKATLVAAFDSATQGLTEDPFENISRVLASGASLEISVKGQKKKDAITVIYQGQSKIDAYAVNTTSEGYKFSKRKGWRRTVGLHFPAC